MNVKYKDADVKKVFLSEIKEGDLFRFSKGTNTSVYIKTNKNDIYGCGVVRLTDGNCDVCDQEAEVLPLNNELTVWY